MISNTLKVACKSVLPLLPHVFHQKVMEWRRPPYQRPENLRLFINFLNTQYSDCQVSVLDIGARLGLVDYGYADLKALKNLYLEGIEPDIAEAARLENTPSLGGYKKVHPVGVADYEGEATLYMTRLKGCASIRKPVQEAIAPFQCASWFEETDKIPINVTTLDILYRERTASFDFIKVDVQGAEYEVLEGGRTLLPNTLGVTLEVQFTPFYEGQKLFPALHAFMLAQGFRLMMLHEESHFYDGEVVEANCAYIRDPSTFTHKHDLLKAILFSLMANNGHYVEFLLRNDTKDLFSMEEKQNILKLLKLHLKREKLALLGEHN